MKSLLKKDISLKAKMMGIILIVLVPMYVIITILFYQTNVTMKKKTIEALDYSINGISSNIDDTLTNIYSVSDLFASEPQLQKIIAQKYPKDRTIEKQHATTLIINKVFARYDLLKRNEKISAIYTYKDELFNFIDQNTSVEKSIQKLKELDIESKDKLGKFYWYPVQDNFLKTDKYNNVRKDKVFIGSRRIFSAEKGLYTGVHIFATSEETLFNKYSQVAEQLNADVYILNGRGELLSSSNLDAIHTGTINKDLVEKIMKREKDNFQWTASRKDYIVSVCNSRINDWISVIVVPVESVAKDINNLYLQIFTVIFGCTILSCIMLIYIYRGFMTPISIINNSMKEVYNGKLDAYVEVKHNNEMGKMMGYYNSMLKSINHNIEMKVHMEKKKKELEMEVLMSQINPHFLYNTLETIVWKSSEVGRPDIGRIAAALGRLYRLSISNGDLIIRMQQEIEHLMAYINIQKSRYGESFEFDLRIDNEIIRNLRTLKIILQPIAENSFLYGMEDLKRKMLIRLSIRVLDDCIEIKVTDNGNGMSKERLEIVRRQIASGIVEDSETKIKRMKKSSGIGLYSVQARLKLYFNMENTVSIYSKEGMGTITVVTIPKLINEK